MTRKEIAKFEDAIMLRCVLDPAFREGFDACMALRLEKVLLESEELLDEIEKSNGA